MKDCEICGKVHYGYCEFKSLHNQHNKIYSMCRECYYNHIKVFNMESKAVMMIKQNPSVLNSSDLKDKLQECLTKDDDSDEKIY